MSTDTATSSAPAQAFYDDLWTATSRLDQHHKSRIHAIEKVLRTVAPSGRLKILEPGCGRGLVSKMLARYGEIVGIDQSAVGIELARESVRGLFVVGQLPQIDFRGGDFDVCVLSQVIEHLQSEDQFHLLRNIHSCMRPGGVLILTTPNKQVSRRMRFVDGELQPIENWLEPTALRELLNGTGWTVTTMFWCFNFFPVTLSRWKPLRMIRYLAYDVLRLRVAIEDLMSSWAVGDTTVAVAVRRS